MHNELRRYVFCIPVRPERSLRRAAAASQTASRSSSVSSHESGLAMIEVRYRVTPAGCTVRLFPASWATGPKLRGLTVSRSRAWMSSVPEGLVWIWGRSNTKPGLSVHYRSDLSGATEGGNVPWRGSSRSALIMLKKSGGAISLTTVIVGLSRQRGSGLLSYNRRRCGEIRLGDLGCRAAKKKSGLPEEERLAWVVPRIGSAAAQRNTRRERDKGWQFRPKAIKQLSRTTMQLIWFGIELQTPGTISPPPSLLLRQDWLNPTWP